MLHVVILHWDVVGRTPAHQPFSSAPSFASVRGFYLMGGGGESQPRIKALTVIPVRVLLAK